MSFDITANNKGERNKLEAFRTLFIFALLFTIYIWGLGRAGLMEPDEGRYAEIPRRMIASGDYVTPRLNGVKYFEKPVLGYWMNAASFKLLGENNFAARIPATLLALAGIAATWVTARKMYGKGTADWSAVVLGTSLLYFSVGRINILDMPLSAFMTITMASAWFVIADEGRRTTWLSVFFASMGLSMLTKGLVGFILPGGILFCYALLSRNPGLLWRFARFLPGYAIFAAVAAPWFLLVCSRNPDFFYFFFIHEHFLRYTTTVHNRMEPFWFFFPIFIAGFIPWLGFLPGAFRDAFREAKESFSRRAQDNKALFLLCWALFILLFFSASHSKLIPYIIPAMPPVAILAARAICLRLEERERKRGLIFGVVLNAVILLALAAGFFTLRYYFQDARYDLKLAWHTGRMIGLAMTLLAILSVACLARSVFPKFSLYVPAAALLLIFTIIPVQRVVASGKSTYEVCENLKQVIGPDDIVINYRDFIQGPQFYLQRRIVLVGMKGELEFGANAEPEQARGFFLTAEEFEQYIDTPTSGDKFILFEDGRGSSLPGFAVKGAVVAATSQNFTAIRLRR